MRFRKFVIFSSLFILLIFLTSCDLSDIKNLISSGTSTEEVEESEEDVDKDLKACKKIIDDVDFDRSKVTTKGFENESIQKKITLKNEDKDILGYAYKISGKNSYGAIVLLVIIDDENKLVSVEFIENGQSYRNEVENHVENKYIEGISREDIIGIDSKCGATYGAKTVKELVLIAYDDLLKE